MFADLRYASCDGNTKSRRCVIEDLSVVIPTLCFTFLCFLLPERTDLVRTPQWCSVRFKASLVSQLAGVHPVTHRGRCLVVMVTGLCADGRWADVIIQHSLITLLIISTWNTDCVIRKLWLILSHRFVCLFTIYLTYSWAVGASFTLHICSRLNASSFTLLKAVKVQGGCIIDILLL